jgi:hypothetical protein
MRKGERFILSKPAVAIDLTCVENRKTIQIPAGALIEIFRAPAPGGRMWEVLWKGCSYLMFDDDLRQRAQRAQTQSAG